jgi:hypothetical protein
MLRQPQQPDHQTTASPAGAAPTNGAAARRRHAPSWAYAHHDARWAREAEGDWLPHGDQQAIERFLVQRGYTAVNRPLGAAAPASLRLYSGPSGYLITLRLGARMEVVEVTSLAALVRLLDEVGPLLDMLA